MTPAEPIAIVGIGCRFPGGANDPASFWKLLSDGVDAIREIPPDRWSIPKYYHAGERRPGKSVSRWGGFVDDPAAFDHEYFGISPREAASVDPQHRMLLLTAAEALTDACEAAAPPGHPRNIGVFVGISTHDYSQLQSAPEQLDHMDAWSLNCIAATLAANRLSFAFDLTGPSLAVDTACSSSLFAVHLACEAIRRGECEAALAGGANALYHAGGFVTFSRAGMLSPTGRCHAFDKSADGFVRAEGAGMILLMPASEARRRGLRVYAEILSTAANQDGRKPSMTAPATSAQQALIEAACDRAGISPSEIRYMEAHGTGTQVGDPSEAAAIAGALGAGRTSPCLVGSVKTNIGHLEAAAGIAGTIKAALCLHHGRVPPNLHFDEANPAIDFAAAGLRVVTETEDLANGGARVIAGVNSFGFGGANAHAILAATGERPGARPSGETDNRSRLLVISAKSPDALSHLAGRYREMLASAAPPHLDDVCLTAGRTQSFLPHRLAICATAGDMDEKLAVAAGGGCPAGATRGRADDRPADPVFVFCGQGSQWAGMGRELLADEPVFAAKLREIARLIRAEVGWSLLDELAKDAGHSRLDDTEIAQPAIFAIQVALAALWDAWGIRPAAVVGHSVGEAAAACVGGALSLEEATRVICHRARSMSVCRGTGTMISVALPVTELRALVSSRSGRVAIGAINSPRSAVLSGKIEDINGVAEELTARGVPLRRVRVEYAFHSALMDPSRARLEKSLADIRTHKPRLPLFSTVTAEASDERDWDAAYWWRNIRQPVLFSDTIARLLALGHRTFLEVGPHPVLGGSLLECLHTAGADAGTRVFSSLRRDKPERETMLTSLGAMVAAGHQPDWDRIYPGARPVRLPDYPWKLESSWTELPVAREGRIGDAAHPLLGRHSSEAPGVWNGKALVSELPWLADHGVNSQPIFPAAAYLEMALAAAARSGGELPFCIENLDFVRALVPANDGPAVRLRFTLGLDGASFEIHSSSATEGSPWVLHARGRLAGRQGIAPPAEADLEALQASFHQTCAGEELRANLRGRGLHLGPAFLGLDSLHWREGEALGRVCRPEILAAESEDYCFHPAFLDACFGVLVGTIPGWREQRSRQLFLPVTFDRVRFHARPDGEIWAHARLTAADSQLITGDLRIYDTGGRCLAEFLGFRARAVATADSAGLLDNALYGEHWIGLPAVAATEAVGGQRILVLAEAEGPGAEIGAALRALGAEVTVAGAYLPGAFDRVVHALNLQKPADAPPDGGLAACSGVVELFRRIQSGPDAPASITVLTCNARAVRHDESVDPAQTAVCGVVRTAALEMPQLKMKLIDVSAPADGTTIGAVAAEIAAEDAESEVALRGGVRHAPRLRRLKPSSLPGSRPLDERPVRVRLRQPGPGVELAALPPREPLAPGHVRLRVEAAGVNFRDTMKALGIYPVTSDLDLVLGDECSGVVIETGPGVAQLAPGDRVIAVTPGCFASEAVAPATHVVRRPDNLDPAGAATLPVVFMTALYALREVGRIKAGDRVLIHSAAGGVGLAALQVARLAGAEIFATAGTDEKRSLLAQLGADHVMDSRTLAFRDGIMKATGGRGVDLVLNSLSGEFLVQSLACLAPGGRFLEIGKRDIYENSKLGLAAFRANQSFSAIDMAQILQHDPDGTRQLLGEIAALAGEGRITPLPHNTRPLSAVAEALRELAQGKHIGKLVLEVPAVPAERAEAKCGPPFRADATYLVTGGVRGFGLATADWLVSRGARHLALVGRSGTGGEALRAARARWKDSGAESAVFAADLSQPSDTVRVLDEIRASMPPLAGIIHAATRYESATLANVDEDNLRASLGPKSLGAWNLHLATAGDPLDFFVLYSSVAGLLGNPGQAAYAAANAFLDGLAARRRSAGQPVLAVDWGVLSDTGHVAEHAEIGTLLERRGLGGMTSDEATAALGELMSAGATAAAVARIQWTREDGSAGPVARVPRLEELIAGAGSGGNAESGGRSARETILALPADERGTAMTADLTAQLAEILRLPTASIEPATPLQDLGLDSLIAIETVIRLERRFGVTLPQGWISQETTVADLAEKLLQLITTTRAVDSGSEAMEATVPAAAAGQPAATTTDATADTETLSAGAEQEPVAAAFYLEWLGLRAAEKFLLGRDIVTARARLHGLMPVFRAALRQDRLWALKNLELVFGPNLDPAQQGALASLAMENHLASYLESGFSHELEFAFENYETLLGLAGERGIILCGVHLGSWEPLLRWAPDVGLRLAAVYRKARNPLAERVFQERRSHYGVEWIASRDTRAIAQAVDDRKIVAFMTDLNTFDAPIFTDFLGVPASCAPGPFALAALKNAPIIAAAGVRESASKVTATFAEPLWPDRGRPLSAEVARLSAALNAAFEPWILEYAEQYNWLHPRWRCRPDGRTWSTQTSATDMAAARTAPFAEPSARLLGVIRESMGGA